MMTRREWTWRVSVMSLFGYEAVAIMSGGRIPLATHAIRTLPRPYRVAVASLIAGAVLDHLETQRLF